MGNLLESVGCGVRITMLLTARIRGWDFTPTTCLLPHRKRARKSLFGACSSGSWTPSRKSELPIRSIHYVLVLKASDRVSGAYERIGLTTRWEQWSLHSQEKDFDIV